MTSSENITSRTELLASLARQIVVDADAQSGPYVIGLTGLDASGKTTLAKELAELLPQDRLITTSIDQYYRPRSDWHDSDTPAESWYHHGLDYKAVISELLEPCQACRADQQPRDVTLATFDRIKDQSLAEPPKATVKPESIVLLEGVFLARPDLAPYLDQLVMIHCEIPTLIERGLKRDAGRLGQADQVLAEYRDRYLAGHVPYLGDASPDTGADPWQSARVVIDNTRPERPSIVPASQTGELALVSQTILTREMPNWTAQDFVQDQQTNPVGV